MDTQPTFAEYTRDIRFWQGLLSEICADEIAAIDRALNPFARITKRTLQAIETVCSLTGSINPPVIGAYFLNRVWHSRISPGVLRSMWADGNFEPALRRVEFADGTFTDGEIVALFERSERKWLMTAEERRSLKSMPNEFTVYRGSTHLSLSWTLDKPTAQDFVRIYNTRGMTDTHLYEATARRDDVLALILDREREIVIDPERLVNLKTTPFRVSQAA